MEKCRVQAENFPYRSFQAAVDHVDLRRYIVSLLRLRPSSGVRNVAPRPEFAREARVPHGLTTASERLAMVLLP
jgi:hypothetical protein